MHSYILLILLPSCWCAVCQAGRPYTEMSARQGAGKRGFDQWRPLSTATPLREALWLHIALVPNEAQLLEENDGFALELQGIITSLFHLSLSASLTSFSPRFLPLSLWLSLDPAYLQRSSLVLFLFHFFASVLRCLSHQSDAKKDWCG